QPVRSPSGRVPPHDDSLYYASSYVYKVLTREILRSYKTLRTRAPRHVLRRQRPAIMMGVEPACVGRSSDTIIVPARTRGDAYAPHRESVRRSRSVARVVDEPSGRSRRSRPAFDQRGRGTGQDGDLHPPETRR